MLSSLKQLTHQFNVMFFFTLYISIAMFWIYFWWVVRIFYFLRAIYQKRQLYIYTPSLIFILFLTIYWLDYLEVVCETSKQEGVFFIVSNNFISFLNVFTYLWLVRKKKVQLISRSKFWEYSFFLCHNRFIQKFLCRLYAALVSKDCPLRNESHIGFRTQCAIITLASGYCWWRFENEKSYRNSKFISCYSPSVQMKYQS